MTDPENPKPEDAKSLWQCQPAELTAMPLDAIHARAAKFQSTVFWRNVREYAASGLSAVIFIFYGISSNNVLVRAGSGLIVVGVLFISLFLFFNGRADREGASASEDCFDFHRKALMRQRDLLNRVWLWYLLPMVPGLTLFVWGLSQNSSFWRSAASIAFLVAVFAGIGLLNTWGARCLQKEIDRLKDQAR